MPQNRGILAPADIPHETTILGTISTVRRELAAMRPGHLDAALQWIAERAQSLTDATGAAIALKQEGSLICVARSGVHAPGLGARLQIGTGFSGQCVCSGEALRCDDALVDSRVDFEVCNVLGVRSIVAVPIKNDNGVTGLIEICSPVARKFLPSNEIMLQELAGLVTLTLTTGLVGSPTSQSLQPAQQEKPNFEALKSTNLRTESPYSPPIRASLNTSEATRKPIRVFVGTLIVSIGVSAVGVTMWRVFPAGRHLADSSRHNGFEHELPPAHRQDRSIPTVPGGLDNVRALAEQGEAAAQFALGAKYAIGDEVEQDYTEAARWFTKAAEHGHSMAQSTLSAYYSQGRGVEKDLTKAYFWSLVAQANGDQFSKERVAFLASQLSTEQAAAVKADADHWIKEHLD